MRFLDLLRMSSSSLWKRKVRTILTVLGVVVGTASIVVMISLGLGLNKASMDQIEQYGGLTTITVMESNDYDAGNVSVATSGTTDDSSSTKKESEKKRLDDELVETISKIPHVEIVSPVLQISVLAKSGGYESNLQLQGMNLAALEKMNLELGEGVLPTEDTGKLEFLYGNQVLCDFANSKAGKGYYYDGTLPDIDLVKDPLFVIFDLDAYYASQNPAEDGKITPQPKKYLINGCGVLAGGVEDYNSNSWSVFCDIVELKKELKKIFKNKIIPGQPTTSSGKAYKELFYNSIYVNVDDMENIKDVQTQITELGYQASSNSDWVEQTKQQYGYIQAVLGGIGAVALFVAAIGITNTMMMSIYERTKEIGIIKVLGCDMKNIQGMFLLEAGYIGLIGGIIGLLLSYLISAIINAIIKTTDMGMSVLSFIPPWLALSAVLFAVVVGMVAGFFPSLRAMQLSPLAAIRNE